jgi:hypothetical protein
MSGIIEKISYPHLILLAIMLGLAPFFPIPHTIEKIQMLINGELKKMIDIFDLIFHTSPIFLIIIKYIVNKKSN